MSTDVKKSRFAWVGTAVETVGFVMLCGFIGIGISMACFTAADTVVNTRDNARRVVELGKRLDALEAQARPKVADDGRGRRGPEQSRPAGCPGCTP